MTSAQKLLTWYQKHGRLLPWRKTRDPYRILVSEIMLQQTQVPRVLLYYSKWLKQFPEWKALARASNADVIRAFAGLGYNRRALVLRDIAKQVGTNGVPTTEEEWRALKGIGPYTAAALTSFSLHKRAFPIDTNIRRVMGRLLLGSTFPESTIDERLKKKLAYFMPKTGRFYDIPQATFDLATSICTKTPNCAVCPLKKDCLASKKFLTGNIKTPKRTIKKSVETKHRDKPFPDRIYRGRILTLVRENGPVARTTIGRAIDPTFKRALDQHWIERMVDRMIKDGLVAKRNNKISLG